MLKITKKPTIKFSAMYPLITNFANNYCIVYCKITNFSILVFVLASQASTQYNKTTGVRQVSMELERVRVMQ